MPRPILVSACLLGLNTRYDGRTKTNAAVRDYLARHDLLPVPVCPEQLAGLSIPRPASQFVSGDGASVLDGHGLLRDATGAEVGAVFLRGARETLKVAEVTGCREALLKERSPSCGCRFVYRAEAIVPGQRVTAAVLARHGLQLLSEEDLPS